MITPIEPTCADAGRYSVTEACSLLGIHRSTLERYRLQQIGVEVFFVWMLAHLPRRLVPLV